MRLDLRYLWKSYQRGLLEDGKDELIVPPGRLLRWIGGALARLMLLANVYFALGWISICSCLSGLYAPRRLPELDPSLLQELSAMTLQVWLICMSMWMVISAVFAVVWGVAKSVWKRGFAGISWLYVRFMLSFFVIFGVGVAVNVAGLAAISIGASFFVLADAYSTPVDFLLCFVPVGCLWLAFKLLPFVENFGATVDAIDKVAFGDLQPL